jgi:hypothetical protein
MQFPPLKHWISHAALIILLPTAIGAVGLLAPMPDLVFITVCFGVVLAILYLWWNAAMQDFRLQRTDETLADVVGKIPHATSVAPSPTALQNLRQLPSDEIRRRTHDVAQRMRAMEAAFHDARHKVLFGNRGDVNDRSRQIMGQSEEQATRWRSDLMSEAVALWDELRRRIYGAPPYPPSKDGLAEVALEYGMLAGVTPLGSAATALEQLARDLP